MGHTPGPWKAGRHNIGDGWRVFVKHHADADQHDAICDLETWQSEKATKANATLIAAAPELLIACKGAIAALSQHKTFPADIDAAKSFLTDAIAKAEGRGL